MVYFPIYLLFTRAFCQSLLLYFCVFYTQIAPAQNLVPNPSFEQFDTCPNNLTQINFANGWHSYRITPDYFNSCAPDTVVVSLSVPSNYWSNQYARTGDAYAGVVTYLSNSSNIREYIGIQLLQSLSIGQTYFASFYVNRAASINNYFNVATNKMGMHFSTVPFSSGSPEPIHNYAQVYTDSVITDSLNWVQISGTFIADSAYNYLSIGCFFNDSLSSHLALDSISGTGYYYIDDVFVSLVKDTASQEIENLTFNPTIKIFPNPARDFITVEGRGIYKLSLYDVLGKLCFSKNNLSSSCEKINVSEWRKGIYFLHVQNLKDNLFQKIVIQ